MKVKRLVTAGTALALTLPALTYGVAADTSTVGSEKVKHVLLLSIDGIHAVDFYNCAHGIAGANDGNPYCPNLAKLAGTGINYVATSSQSLRTQHPDSWPWSLPRT